MYKHAQTISLHQILSEVTTHDNHNNILCTCTAFILYTPSRQNAGSTAVAHGAVTMDVMLSCRELKQIEQ